MSEQLKTIRESRGRIVTATKNALGIFNRASTAFSAKSGGAANDLYQVYMELLRTQDEIDKLIERIPGRVRDFEDSEVGRRSL